MLGVVHMQRLRYRESLKLLLEAAEKSNWALPQIRHNLGLVLGKLETREANEKQAELLARSVALERERLAARKDFSPLVTGVLAEYNHASFVGEAVASISAQGYAHIGGGRHRRWFHGCDSGNHCRSLRFPARLITRPNRGAAATLNEGAALAQGQYLAFLNSDDYYASRLHRVQGGRSCPKKRPVRLFTGGRCGLACRCLGLVRAAGSQSAPAESCVNRIEAS